MEFTRIEILGALGVLMTVITSLWFLLNSYIKKDAAKLEKFEMMHDINQKQIVDMTGDYRELKGRVHSVETLSRSVLDEIRNLR